MKRYFYIFLVMIITSITIFFVYYAILFGLIFHRIISLDYVIPVTDIFLSDVAHIVLLLISIGVGYITGKKWWKIIYIDKVYRFKK